HGRRLAGTAPERVLVARRDRRRQHRRVGLLLPAHREGHVPRRYERARVARAARGLVRAHVRLPLLDGAGRRLRALLQQDRRPDDEPRAPPELTRELDERNRRGAEIAERRAESSLRTLCASAVFLFFASSDLSWSFTGYSARGASAKSVP